MLLFSSLATTHGISFVWPVTFCFLVGLLVPEISAKDYWDAGLKKNNEYRARHGVPLLELDTEIAENADKCTQWLADNNRFDHGCPYKGGASDNLFKGYAKNKDAVASVEEAMKRWYDEIRDYDFNKNDAKDGKGFQNIGHFTQLTWKNSKKLGIGYTKVGDICYVAALYSPPGNYRGQYKDNVLPPTSGSGGLRGQNSTSSSIVIAACLELSLCVIFVVSLNEGYRLGTVYET